MPSMSDDADALTPTNLRTLSVPATPGRSPAAPLKKHMCARSYPSPPEPEGERAESNIPEPRNLSSAFDTVASRPGVRLPSAVSLPSAADLDASQEETQNSSLSLPLSQAPVKPSALPEASISERANGLRSLEDSPGTPPSDEPLRENPKPAVGASVPSDEAEVCPPSPPQSIRSISGLASVPTKETLLGMTYKGATLPHDDAERLRTVALLGILDQPEDPVLASITKLIVKLLKVSTAGINIIDRDRLWWPSISTSGPLPPHGWTHPRQIGFCSYTLLAEAAEVLVVEDASKDHRFKDSPFVTGFPHIRFYGGAPLIASNGHRIGAICAIDQQRRSLSSQQLGVLAHLAEMVVRRVERDKQILLQQHSKTALLRSLRNQQEAVLMCDTAMTSWPVLFTNKSCHEMLGLDEGTLGGRGVWDIFKMDAGAKEASEKALAQRSRFTITASATKFPTHSRKMQLDFRPANTPTSIHPSLQIGIPAFIADREDIFQLYFVTVRPVPQILTAPGKMQAEMRPHSAGTSVMRPSDSWAKRHTAPAYSSFPSDIRHTKTRQNLVANNCEVPSLQQSQFEEVQLGMLLGGSSSGNVYRGLWRSIPVAVKKTRARLTDCVAKGEKDALITQEAAAAMGVSHPHLVTTYKYAIKYHEKGAANDEVKIHEDGKPLLPGTAECWLFTEMCNKGTLQHAIDGGWLVTSEGKPKLVALLSSAWEASLGVAHLHREGVIHGGLAPATCFLKAGRNQRGFVVKVGDLGRSSVGGKGVSIDVRRGLRFQSPEAICSGTTSKEGDAYAFGVMLYELYSGLPAWAGMSTGDIISAKLRSHASQALRMSADCPLALQDLVDRCLASNPAMRPSLSDISDALLALRDSLALNTAHPPLTQSLPQQSSTQQPSPFFQPPAPSPSPQSGTDARQAVTRQRINATQYQLPVRRQTGVSQDGLIRQGSTPQVPRQFRDGLIRQGSTPQVPSRQTDRIPAEWGRIAKLESRRSAPLTNELAQAAAAAATTTASVPDSPRMTRTDGSSQTDAPETARAPCLQHIWRTVGFCYMAKQTKSFVEDPTTGHVQAAQAHAVQGRPTAVEGNDVAGVDGVNAGSKQGHPKMSLRVKKIFVDQSKQLRHCMVTACK